MVHIYEFEFVEDGGWYLAFPFDMEGGTQGVDLAEASEMAAEWLKSEIEWRVIHGEELPAPTFGNEPRRGGRVVLLAVEAGLETVHKVTAAEAARLLGVSPGRVTQLIDAGHLVGWREGHRTWVTVDSVEARLAEEHRAGRPRKEAASA